MFSRQKNWLSGGIWRPKNLHSLEHLKLLYNVICKNQSVTEQNKGLLVETMRSMSEILIWGDQNDSTVIDFFLEKNMLSFFLKFMRQKHGQFICVQLLQTLNILFENIRNETSIYYLLSNNHINSIIEHKFDFSDEEVMAYYISFLKTLSLKLNSHTIHFFYNEHTNEFALYTEAIKFFNHSESMVRIAVRTITLNVFKVQDSSMLRFIRDRTAAPYFSNLVWFIGSHILELNICLQSDADHNNRNLLADLVAEHLDHLHYLNDILCLNIPELNAVLSEHLLHHLLIPIHVCSLRRKSSKYSPSQKQPHVSQVVSLFLISQVFLIFSHSPLVRQLADLILNGSSSDCQKSNFGFEKPHQALDKMMEKSHSRAVDSASEIEEEGVEVTESLLPSTNCTDEEKLLNNAASSSQFSLANRHHLEVIFTSLDCANTDYECLFALCLLFAVGHNEGINQDLLDSVSITTNRSESKGHYNVLLVERLIQIMQAACQPSSRVRLATLEMAILLLKQLVLAETKCFLQDRHLAALEGVKEEATLNLRNYFKSEEIFLDMFEDEWQEMNIHPLNVEYLMMDANILLPPTKTPLTGIEFRKRLACGEVEQARAAIRVFLLLRQVSLELRSLSEMLLPLTRSEDCVMVDDVLDLNNSDLIACTVLSDEQRDRRFLVIDTHQLILVEPEARRLGWGVVKLVGLLQDVEVRGDADDSRALFIIIQRPWPSSARVRPLPILSSKFMFDDHIRCMAAKQRLTKGRLRARQRKMQTIARLLELPTELVESMLPAERRRPLRSVKHPGAAARIVTSKGEASTPVENRPRDQALNHGRQIFQAKRSAISSGSLSPFEKKLKAPVPASLRFSRSLTPDRASKVSMSLAQIGRSGSDPVLSARARSCEPTLKRKQRYVEQRQSMLDISASRSRQLRRIKARLKADARKRVSSLSPEEPLVECQDPSFCSGLTDDKEKLLLSPKSLRPAAGPVVSLVDEQLSKLSSTVPTLLPPTSRLRSASEPTDPGLSLALLKINEDPVQNLTADKTVGDKVSGDDKDISPASNIFRGATGEGLQSE